MIRIAKLTEYAILTLSQMAKESNSTLSATYLAEMLHLTPSTVSKILKILADAGFVQSVRGSDGGYHLTRPAAEISIVDVINAMEGEIAMTECCEEKNNCQIADVCAMRGNWNKINNMIKDLLAKFSVIDITGPVST